MVALKVLPKVSFYILYPGVSRDPVTRACTLFFVKCNLKQDKLKRCSNKECCKQCRYVMFKGTMTQWPVQKLTQGTTQKTLTTS